ncbi:hypothetical protein AAY473_020081 [Plecturocebus cupreus]
MPGKPEQAEVGFLPPATLGSRFAQGKEGPTTGEERVETQGPAIQGQEPRPRPETSRALSRARRSPPYPRRPCRHSRPHRLALGCALSATGTCSLGAVRSLLPRALQSPGAAATTQPRPRLGTRFSPSRGPGRSPTRHGPGLGQTAGQLVAQTGVCAPRLSAHSPCGKSRRGTGGGGGGSRRR